MTGLDFLQPTWFLALLAFFPLLVLRVYSQVRTVKQLPGLVSPRLMSRLVSGSSQSQRWVAFFLYFLAFTSMVVALARPVWGFDEIETETAERSLIVAVDTSRSMLAADLPPSRLERARLAAKDIVISLPEDRIGVMAFAGRPFLQAPLTVDHEAVLESIDQLDTEIIPRGGTNLAEAVSLALDTFEESKLEQGALVIFSDGEALEGLDRLEEVRDRAAELGITILTVGVGTVEGDIIPELDRTGNPVAGVFVKDEQGQVVRSRLDTSALQLLASKGGSFVHLGGKASMTRVVDEIRNNIASSREEGETKLRPIERFMWFLVAAVLFLLGGYVVPLLWLKPRQRSRSAVLLRAPALIVTLLFPTLLSAKDPLWTGHREFERQEYDKALQTYESALSGKTTEEDRARLHMGIAAAAYRTGDYDRAIEAYGQALVEEKEQLRETAHYNLGNALYRRGEAALQVLRKPANPDQLQSLASPSEMLSATIAQWESAVEHFESALALNEGNRMAAHNAEVVRKKIEELKEEQQQQQEQQQEQQKEEEQEEQEKKEEEKKEEEQEKEDEGDQEDKGEQEESGEKEKEKEKEKKEPGDNQEEKDQEKEEPKDGDPGDQEDPQDKPEESPEDNPQDQPKDEQQPQDGQPKDEPEDGQPKDEGDGKDREGDQGEQPEPQQPQPESDAPQDGKLEANPNQSQPQIPQNLSPADLKTNPETGYSPSDARQLLEALADETEVRPVLQPFRGENYKNW